MPLPADRLRQLRAIILKAEKSQNLVKNRAWYKGQSPTNFRRIGFDWQGSWVEARRNVANRLRTMRRTGKPDVQLYIGVPARGKYHKQDLLEGARPGYLETNTRKIYKVRMLPLSRRERDNMLLQEASRQFSVRAARRDLYRHLRKMRNQ